MQDFFYLNFLLHKNSPGIQTLLSISPELFLFLHDLIAVKFSYFLIKSDLPVISFGCSIPISSIRVGAISARQPPSLRP